MYKCYRFTHYLKYTASILTNLSTFLSPSRTGGMQYQSSVHTFTVLGKTAVTIVLVEAVLLNS